MKQIERSIGTSPARFYFNDLSIGWHIQLQLLFREYLSVTVVLILVRFRPKFYKSKNLLNIYFKRVISIHPGERKYRINNLQQKSNSCLKYLFTSVTNCNHYKFVTYFSDSI